MASSYLNRALCSAACLSCASGVAIATELCWHLVDVAQGCSYLPVPAPGKCIYSTAVDILVKDAVSSQTVPGRTTANSSLTVVCDRVIGYIDSEGKCSIDGWSMSESAQTTHSSLSGAPCNVTPGGGA